MDRIPLYCGGRETGTAELEHQPPYTVFRVCVPVRTGLWCAWAVGETGELRIGVLEPCGAEAVIERRFSRQVLASAGRLLRLEVRPVGDPDGGTSAWRTPEPDRFRDPALRRLAETPGVLCRAAGEQRLLSVPFRPDTPFPLPALFCLFHTEAAGGQTRWILPLNRDGQPVF